MGLWDWRAREREREREKYFREGEEKLGLVGGGGSVGGDGSIVVAVVRVVCLR